MPSPQRGGAPQPAIMCGKPSNASARHRYPIRFISLYSMNGEKKQSVEKRRKNASEENNIFFSKSMS
jgi:hypothetical protein